MIYVFLADGFEETEATAPVDLLRRAKKDVVTVGVGKNTVTGSHKITVLTDTTTNKIVLDDSLEMIVLPGGMPGTLNLEADETVQKAIDFCIENNKIIGAICAAPSILGHKGLLKGRKAVCYTGFEKELTGAVIADCPAVADENIVTSRGAGTALDFGLKLIEVLDSKALSEQIKSAILFE